MKITILAIILTTVSASAQYAIAWFTIDGGGGQSSGGAYALVGTTGQSDAATSSGGAYTLHGGFWGAFAVVQTEGAPLLRIRQNGASVTLAWPDPSIGFQLQESPSLAAPNWTDVNTAPTVVNDERQWNQALRPGTRFYRLRKP